MDVAELADAVLLKMLELPSTAVIAVWEDGTLTVEKFSFWGRKVDGHWERPLAAFLVGARPPSRHEIIQRLAGELLNRGWSQAS